MGGQYGVKETKEVLDGVFAGVAAFQSAKEDGKIDLADIQHLIPLFVTLAPAIDKIDQMPKELGELDQADADDILAHASVKLPGLVGLELAKKVNAALKVAVAVGQLIAELKSTQTVVVMPVPAA